MSSLWDNIKNLLITETPFSFIKMNDGELQCIVNKGGLSRGDQEYNSNMDKVLSEALVYNAINYLVGIPCHVCYYDLYKYCMDKVKNPYPANLLINQNFKKSFDLFSEILPKRNVLLVTNINSDISKLPFTPSITLRVPEKNSWNSFNELKDLHKLIPSRTVVIFCCGPLGRGLAYEWFKNNNRITCIELGSFFDPWTRGKAYQYHLGTHRKCDGCCPVNSEPIPLEIIQQCKSLERVFWYDPRWEVLQHIYGSKQELKQAFFIMSKNPESSDHEYYYTWIYNKLLIELTSEEDKKKEIAKNYIDFSLKNYKNRVEGIFELGTYLDPKDYVNYLWKISAINVNDKIKFSNVNISDYKIYETLINEEFRLQNYLKSFRAFELLEEKENFLNKKLVSKLSEITKLNVSNSKTFLEQEKKNNKFLNDLLSIQIDNTTDDDTIPRIFHFIYIVGNHKFAMAHYVAIKSCLEVQKAKSVHVWHGVENDDLKNNKWWQKTKEIAQMHLVTIPTYVNNNHVWFQQHQADYMRINILYHFGGTYMDLDILSHRPLDGTSTDNIKAIFEDKTITDPNLFKQNMVMCRECPEKISNSVIMAKKGHPFLKEWIYRYDTQYTQDWTLLSVQTPHYLNQQHPEYKLTVLETKTFLPFMYQDFRFFYYDCTEWLINESLLIHLWDTESFKANMIPMDIDYYDKYPNNTFTRLFKKYTDSA